MHKPRVAVVALTSFALLAGGRMASLSAGHSQPPQAGAAAQESGVEGLRITLLGTGGGPPVNLRQFGASTLVEAGGKRLLFDCGRGATIRLAQAGVPLGSVGGFFLTPLPFHHGVEIPGLSAGGLGGAARGEGAAA